ncbi:hypothetical protein [Rhizobium rhizogenes]|uniref:Uncharacterized protein n=1 Tax=Rhizobium rhizogenes (strain K84 / ATCC BAA-868) TaxID=311403 RepID=B9J9F6_RHIR8|nr:hypothetical protein Arad_3656 [Rhizobium rhizogenes K84]
MDVASWTFWLSIFGAVTGCFGLIVSIASAWFTRRQAVAAEGPQAPEIEVSGGEWDKDTDGWFRITITTRNLTNKSWQMISAIVKSPKLAKLISIHEISSIDAGGRYIPMHLSLVQPSSISDSAKAITSVAPYGTQANNRYVGNKDFFSEEFLVYIPAGYRRKSVIPLSITFTLQDRTAIARPRHIKLVRKLSPKTTM